MDIIQLTEAERHLLVNYWGLPVGQVLFQPEYKSLVEKGLLTSKDCSLQPFKPSFRLSLTPKGRVMRKQLICERLEAIPKSGGG